MLRRGYPSRTGSVAGAPAAQLGRNPMPEPGPKRRPGKIDPWARWVSGAVGAAGLGAGGAATFTTSVEAGPVALIAVGTLFLIAALAGVLPNRLKFGDNEAEWGEAVGEALADVVELVGPEDRAEAISSLQNLALVAPETAAPALRGLAYEQLIFGMLASAIATLNEPRGPEEQFRLSTNVRGHGRELDAVIVSPTGAEVAVEIKGYSR